jgi:hypothetical protein
MNTWGAVSMNTFKNRMIQFSTILSFTIAATLQAPSALSSTTTQLIRLLESPLGRIFLTEKDRGADIVSRIMGHYLQAGDDIGALLTRLDEPEFEKVAKQLERGLTRSEIRLGPQASSMRLNRELAQRVLLDEIKIPIGFFPPTARSGYDATRQIFLRMLEVQAANAQKLLRYPLGVDPMVHPDWHLQFGFESEYTLRDAEKLLEVYGPDRGFGISTGQWHNMRSEERVRWVQNNLERLFPEERKAGKLVKIDNDPALEFLPKNLIKDSTGNLEIILKPFQTLEDWLSNITLLNERLGVGSMQGTISVPSSAFFGKIPGHSVAQSIQEDLGFFNFMNDFDTLQKLESGAKRYLTDPTKDVAKSFSHPFLGPMSRLKQGRLKEFLEANADDRRLDPSSLESVSMSDASFKYIGGTAYRPDIAAPYRVIFEVRDAHTNMDSLLERMLRTTFFTQFGRQQFRAAANIEAFDSVNDFSKLSRSVQEMLKQLFPMKTIPGIHYNNEEQLALQVYRNFAYPLRDWENHLRFLGERGLSQRIALAKESYTFKLETIARALAAGQISANEASLSIQGALVQFSAESRMTQAFRRWQSKNLLSSKAWNTYANITLQELDPLAHAFPKSVWEGSLEIRTARLLNKWKDNVRLVDDVAFTYEAGGYQKVSRRKVLVVSTNGLSPEQQTKLMKDYLNALSRGTISFPMSERAGHLYTRIGHRSIDVFGIANLTDYKLSQGARIEPFLALSPEEELKLRFYIEMVLRDQNGVVGSSRIGGIPSGRTGGRLRDNRPLDSSEAHNCTSWLCTAPIGSSKQPVLELAGASISQDIHTNPGWWAYFLAGAARSERVPLVAYWTQEPLRTTENTIRSGQAFPAWDFNLH